MEYLAVLVVSAILIALLFKVGFTYSVIYLFKEKQREWNSTVSGRITLSGVHCTIFHQSY